jgi:hypothetical protein
MPGTVSTACKTFQATLKRVWASGSTYSEMTLFLGVTKDQLFRLRDRLKLPLRLDRSKRAKPPRHADPTPAEIAAACAELRAKHLEQRRNEPRDRTYVSQREFVVYRLEQSKTVSLDPLEQLLDNFGDS